MRRVALFLPVTVLLAGFALAWNPISVQSGGALRWDASAPIEWNPDGGVLGRWNNATATAEMGTAFGVWQNVGTALITYSQGTQIENTSGTPVDVDSSNYAEIINLPGQNPIIYDNDRDIYDMLGVPDGVLGFAGVLRTDGAGTITQGFAVFQGDWIDDDTGDVGDVTDLVYQGVVVHEFGHFSGLGHTTVNRHLTSGIGSCAPTTNFATMNPFIHSGASTTHNDDRAGISALYPTSGYAGRASISGNLIGLDGVNGFDGANMILRQDTTSCNLIYSQVQAMQSGVNPGEDGGSGGYAFRGLELSTRWTLEVTSVQGGGSYPIGGENPPALPAPDEFYNGADEAGSNPPDEPTAFQVLEIDEHVPIAGIDIVLNHVDGPGELGDGPDGLRVETFDGATPGPQETLILDDGDIDSVFGFQETVRTAWISRFTPSASQLPFRIDAVQLLFFDLDQSIAVGRNIQLLVLVDPGGTGDPDNATAVALTSPNRTIQEFIAFTEYAVSAVDPDDLLVTSGDVYLGAFDLDGGDATTNFIAASDNDTVGENTAFVGYSFDDNVPTSFVHITDPSVGAPADRTWMVRAVGANLPPSGTIRLSWGEPCNADIVPGQDFAVYEGTIASLSGVQDHAPIACGTGLEHQYVPTPSAGNRFWLVAPLIPGTEGSQGTGSSTPRDPVSTCAPVSPGTCPP